MNIKKIGKQGSTKVAWQEVHDGFSDLGLSEAEAMMNTKKIKNDLMIIRKQLKSVQPFYEKLKGTKQKFSPNKEGVQEHTGNFKYEVTFMNDKKCVLSAIEIY